jgi:divalent metal cation (Fe/Co/Zn/Cd) transporter
MVKQDDADAVRRDGRRLCVLSIMIALLEGGLSIPAGLAASSIALVGFGLDSVIEASSSAAVLWGMVQPDESKRELQDKRSLRFVGATLLLLAAYITYESLHDLLAHEHAQRSLFGIAVLLASGVAMIWLRGAKRAFAARLDSDALAADAKQSEFCAYLSGVALLGLGANAAFGWWWADPAAALVMVPIIVREGVEAAQGKACAHDVLARERGR